MASVADYIASRIISGAVSYEDAIAKYPKMKDEIDAALLKVYLNRPDLVKATETDLQETGSIRDDVNVPIGNKVASSFR